MYNVHCALYRLINEEDWGPSLEDLWVWPKGLAQGPKSLKAWSLGLKISLKVLEVFEALLRCLGAWPNGLEN